MNRLFKRSVAFLAVSAMLLVAGCTKQESVESKIGVQVNGADVTLTGAAPVKEGNNKYIPAKDVFAALGYTYTEDGDKLTVDNGRSKVEATVGSADAKLTRNGETTDIKLETAPKKDGETVLVPVHMLERALGMKTGYDENAKKVVVVDLIKVADEAMAGKTYKYYDMYEANSNRYGEGIWDFDVTIKGKQEIDGSLTDVNAALKGTAQDQRKFKLNAKVDMDLTDYMNDHATATTDEEKQLTAFLNSVNAEGVDFEIRVDLNEKMLYVHGAGAGVHNHILEADTWYSGDLSKLSGTTYEEYIEELVYMREADNNRTLIMVGAGTLVDYNSVDAYKQAVELAGNIAKNRADDTFTKTETGVTTKYEYASEIDNVKGNNELSLTLDNDKLVASTFKQVSTRKNEEGKEVVTETVTTDKGDGTVIQTTKETVDGKVIEEYTQTGKYTKGTAAPETTAPQGAKTQKLGEAIPQLTQLLQASLSE